MDWSSLWTFLASAVDPYVINVAFLVIVVFIVWQLRICVVGGQRRELKQEERIDRLEKKNDVVERDLWKVRGDYARSIEAAQGIQTRLLQLQRTLERIKVFSEDYAPSIDYGDGAVERYLREIIHSVREDLRRHEDETHRCGIWIPTDIGDSLKMVVSSGFRGEHERSLRLAVDKSIAGAVIRRGRSRLTGRASVEPDYQHVDESHEFESLICVPIRGQQQQVIGVLTVDGKNEHSFDGHDQLVAEAYASVAGLYLQRQMDEGERQ